MARRDATAIRSVSRHAFGQAHRLELMLAILDSPGPICLKDLSEILAVTASSLQRPFAQLIALGLLVPEDGDGTRKRLYMKADSTAWPWALELAEIAIRSDSSNTRP